MLFLAAIFPEERSKPDVYFNLDKPFWHAAPAASLWVEHPYHTTGLGTEMNKGRQPLTSEEPTPGHLRAVGFGGRALPGNRHPHVPGTPWSNPMQTPPCTRRSSSPSSSRTDQKKLIPLQRVSSPKLNGKWSFFSAIYNTGDLRWLNTNSVKRLHNDILQYSKYYMLLCS